MEYNEELYKWIDGHPITRPKRNISRDFSDAVPLVEILFKIPLTEKSGIAQLQPAKFSATKIGKLVHFKQKSFEKIKTGSVQCRYGRISSI